MSVQQAVLERLFRATGWPIVEGYGLSETSPVLTCNPATATEWSGTIGLPLPSTDISIRDDDNNELPVGERGEICARGPQVMAGYWQHPDQTTAAMRLTVISALVISASSTRWAGSGSSTARRT